TGKPAACFIITGPGLTNITTAMGQAYAESTPMLVISSVSHRRHLGRGLGQLHEMPDQQGLLSKVSAFSHTMHDLRDLPAVLDRAFAVFNADRPRPVHIEIPLDLWQQPPAELPAPDPVVFSPATPAASALEQAATKLTAAEKPLLIAGGGARGQGKALQQLAEQLD